MNLKENQWWFYPSLIIILTIVLLHKILFTNQIIYATDVMTQTFWEVVNLSKRSFIERLTSYWAPVDVFGMDGTLGKTRELLPYRFIIQKIFPPYLAIAWEAVTHIIFAGIGTYLYCRIIKLQKFSSFIAAISFIFSAEIITLLNAGHVGKINTISWVPMVLFLLEKGLQERKPLYFLLTGGALAFQFFEMHWQIAFYTCLAIGFYFIFRMGAIYKDSRNAKETAKVAVFAVAMVLVYFMTVSVSFLPVYSWSKLTERGGGMSYEDAMGWSMPPEELVTYLIPGFFGLNRRESGFDPGYIDIFYWGRMWFAQATDYMGILPLVLAGMAILYKRNRYTWLFASMTLLTILMGMGKYTPVYRFMYEYLPGFSTFRVPKMILFLPAFTVAILAGIGADWLLYSEDDSKRKRVKSVIYGLLGLLAISALLTLFAWIGKEGLMGTFHSALSRPGRYINDPNIVYNRYVNIIQWACFYLVMLSISIGLLWLFLKEKVNKVYIQALMALFLIVDVWSVNGKFISTYPPAKTAPNANIGFLKSDKEIYRVQPMGMSEFYYSTFGIQLSMGYAAVVENYYREFLNHMDMNNNLIDLMNVKYLIMPKAEFGENGPTLGSMMGKYIVAFNGEPDSVILMNTSYTPRAYPVHQAVVERDKDLIFNILTYPQFKPREMVVLEEAPPAPFQPLIPSSSSKVTISRYANDKITINADMAQDGFLVLSEKYYPGWKAYVDGKETKIYKANYAMRAVYLPNGAHKVEFIFDPWPYKVGLWVSSATFLFLIGAVLWRVRHRTSESVDQR